MGSFRYGPEIPECPTGFALEDLICALFAASGWFVYPSIKHHEGVDELMELDLLGTKFTESSVRRALVEVKSGGWGWNDVLKLLGRQTFLEVGESHFFATSRDRDVDSAIAK